MLDDLKSAIRHKLTLDNGYVSHFSPEQDGYYEERDDFGNQKCYPFHKSDEDVKEEAIEGLVDDNSGWFDEFIHEELRDELTEFCRKLIKDMIK